MARRRKQEEQEEKEEEVFKFPEFDEKEYITKEIEKSKATIGIAVLATLFALISAYIFSFSFSWPISAMVGLLGFLLFKFVYPLFKVDSSVLEKKDYAGHVFVYLFTWLAIFIMVVNTPFMDLTSPQISNVHLEGSYNGTWQPYNRTNASQYRILAEVTDNSGVQSVQIMVNSSWVDMQDIGNGLYSYSLGNHRPYKGEEFHIRAYDINHHESEYTWRMD